MNLFQLQNFVMHSGEPTFWKIDCDALTDADLATMARLIATSLRFGRVIGVPRGGLRLAEALQNYISPEHPVVLVVDDVLTTGASMVEARRQAFREGHEEVVGVVLFARRRPPDWIKPVFQFWDWE